MFGASNYQNRTEVLKLKRFLRYMALAAMTVSFTAQANAHGIWVGEQQSKLTIILGEGAANDAYSTQKVVSVEGFDPHMKPVKVQTRAADDHMVITDTKDASLITVKFDHGYWAQSQDGKWHNEKRSQIKDPKGPGMRALKFTTMYLDPKFSPRQLPGMDLQLVPSVNPLNLKKGDHLTIQALLNGKPAKGITIYPDFIADMGQEIKADSQGQATVVVPSAGLNVIGCKVTIDNPSKGDPDAEKINYFATLTFNLQEEDH
jgi:uncharacterized GH25 family protein